jgi:sugar O-acyltransferase (sialic acid O-acetyltransferase NeuD family)
MGNFIIIGAGGHGKVVADILLRSGLTIGGFLDDSPDAIGSIRFGLPVLGPIDSYQHHAPDALILGIGSNAVRKAIVERLGESAHDLWHNAIHPSAVIAPSVQLGVGLVVAAGAVINPDSIIGDHVIINTSASVEHDCNIEAYSHLAQGSHLGGEVTVRQGALLGMGSVAVSGITIGSWSVISPATAVLHNIANSY